MHDADPFAILGIAPTLDRQAIKRAYFAAAKRTPPHADPDAFRRVRTAYEELNDERRLRPAWLRAPIDTERLLERWNARFRERIEAAAAAQLASTKRERALALFVERCASVRLSEVGDLNAT